MYKKTHTHALALSSDKPTLVQPFTRQPRGTDHFAVHLEPSGQTREDRMKTLDMFVVAQPSPKGEFGRPETFSPTWRTGELVKDLKVQHETGSDPCVCHDSAEKDFLSY